MTNNVSMLVQSRTTQRNIARLQNNLIQSGNEVTTGKKQNLIQDLGGEIRNFVDLKSMRSALMNRTQRLDTGDNRLSQMGTAVEEIKNLSTPFQDLQAQLSLITRGNIDVYIKQADSALQSVQTALNIQWGGRYLFSGDDVTQRPIEGIETLTTTIKQMITDYAATLPTGKITRDDELNTLMTEIDSVFNDTHATTNFSTLVYKGSNTDMAGIEISDGEIMSYEHRANSAEFKKSIKGFTMLAAANTIRSVVDGTDTARLNKIEKNYMEKAVAFTTESITDMIRVQATVGIKQQQIQFRKDGLERTIFDYEQRISNYENADQYKAGVEYSEVQQQLEASFYVTSSISQLSLLNYIR
jgi:flagellar hook-associated protein 3 FlgL